MLCVAKNSFTPITFLLPKFLPPVLLNQPTNSRFQPKPPIVLIAPVQASLSLTSESISEVTGKKIEEFWLAKNFRNLPFVVYLIFAYPTLSFSFRKKSILFKSTFVKRRGIFDHSSQDGILWHAKKVTNIINSIRFVASTFCITQG